MNQRRALAGLLVVAFVLAAWLLLRMEPTRPAQQPVSVPAQPAAPAAAASSAQRTGTTVAGQPAGVPSVNPAVPATPPKPPVSVPVVNPQRPPRTVYMPPEPDLSQRDGFKDVEATKRMIKNYREISGENPTGTNADIMKSMMGGNKKGAMLGPPEGMSINGGGELVDQWGTPIFFHALSKEEMEIRSAGPDRVMWTGDDIVTK